MRPERFLKDLPKNARQIKNSKDFIDPDGNVYTPITNYKGQHSGGFMKKALHKNPKNGYLYCGIYDNEIKNTKNRRVHRVVAETFLPNPDNLPAVGHRNNIKCDPKLSNLYWTTYSENSQKAVDDGLLVNDKSWNDSQSNPVAMYDTCTNECLGVYGSCREAQRDTGVPITTIMRQAKYHRPVRKPWYFRFLDDKTAPPQKIIGMFRYDDDMLVKMFFNTGIAAKETNGCEKTISQQCHKGKPKHKFSEYYFGYVESKCEQTIESTTQVE